MNTMLFTVPALSEDLGEGSLAVSRVLQDFPGLSRISVESREVDSRKLSPTTLPPVTSRTWIKMMKC